MTLPFLISLFVIENFRKLNWSPGLRFLLPPNPVLRAWCSLQCYKTVFLQNIVVHSLVYITFTWSMRIGPICKEIRKQNSTKGGVELQCLLWRILPRWLGRELWHTSFYIVPKWPDFPISASIVMKCGCLWEDVTSGGLALCSWSNHWTLTVSSVIVCTS